MAKVTEKQQETVHTIEQTLYIQFDGDINDIEQVENFILENIDACIDILEEYKYMYKQCLKECF